MTLNIRLRALQKHSTKVGDFGIRPAAIMATTSLLAFKPVKNTRALFYKKTQYVSLNG
jgi:hypothetical protein